MSNKYKIARTEDLTVAIPEKATVPDVIKFLKAFQESQEQVVTPYATFPVTPQEGALCLSRVIERLFGLSVAKPGDWGQPPAMLTVNTGYNKTESCVWGNINFPQIGDGTIRPDIQPNGNFLLRGEFRGKYQDIFDKIVEEMRVEILNSPYKGAAINVQFWADGGLLSIPNITFPEVKGTKPIFNPETEAAVEMSVVNPVVYADRVREHMGPGSLKRGILLAGPWGTGKSMLANYMRKVATDHGWTYLNCASVKDVPKAIELARRLSPCVVFVEDIDRGLSGDRNEAMDEILNTIDGIDGKESEVMVIMTTNHLEHINQAAKRPGRMDAIIRVGYPMEDAAKRLVMMYAGDSLTDAENLDTVGEALAGYPPCAIAEVVKRAHLSAIALTPGRLSTKDILAAAETISDHIREVQTKHEEKQSDLVSAAMIIANAISR